ncbi:MAG: SLOG family protein, partial [Oscillospiraceae bacterium]|nr:SLOG family protein [Oscillospiraceae bacterium]
IVGAAPGFEQIAASLLLAKREAGALITLLLALPCKDEDAAWPEKQRKLYRRLLEAADEVQYAAKIYDDFCARRRVHAMVDQSAYCLCVCLEPSGNTADAVTCDAVAYARQKGLKVVNVAG